MTRRMYLYPWDVRDEGAPLVARRLRAAGIESVAIATSYHAGRFLRPHAPAGRIYYPEDGTIYFRPDERLYGRLKPAVARVAADFDALGAMQDAAPEMARAGWTIGLHNSRLGRLNPDLVCRTAFGDPIHSALCPAHPEVADYLVALCVDQGRNRPVDEIVVEAPGFQAYRHNDHHEFELVELRPRAMSLLGLCFCPACLAGAARESVDAAALRDRAVDELEAFFADDPGPDEPDLAEDADWRPFLDWRARTVAGLVARIRDALPADVALAIIPTVRTPVADCWREGADLELLSAVADRLEIPIYRQGPADAAHDMRAARRAAGPAAALSFILRPSWPTLRGPAELGEALAAAGETGAASIAFYNYGHLRLRSLDWIGMQAPAPASPQSAGTPA